MGISHTNQQAQLIEDAEYALEHSAHEVYAINLGSEYDVRCHTCDMPLVLEYVAPEHLNRFPMAKVI
jgi:hypothetical protein